ncbi:MAG TPA: hypothetical protein VFR02_00960 [bacterium]|nr:hypothetical protein [bacterium]
MKSWVWVVLAGLALGPAGAEEPLPTPTPTASPSASATPSCAAPGASAASGDARNYTAWCAPGLPGVIFEQDDANNGVAYSVFNGTDVPVDVRLGAKSLVNMDPNLRDGWVRVAPRKQEDLGKLTAHDPNWSWSASVTATAQPAP